MKIERAFQLSVLVGLLGMAWTKGGLSPYHEDTSSKVQLDLLSKSGTALAGLEIIKVRFGSFFAPSTGIKIWLRLDQSSSKNPEEFSVDADNFSS